MYQQDYILRIIEEAAQMLAAIIMFRKSGKNEEAEDTLNKCYTDLLNLEPGFFVKHSGKEIIAEFLDARGYSIDQLYIIVRLIKEEALLCREKETLISLESKWEYLHAYIEQNGKTLLFE